MVDRDGLRDACSDHGRRIRRLARRLPDRISAYEARLPHALRPGPARRARGVERTSAVADRTRAAWKASAAALAGAARQRIIRPIGGPDDRKRRDLRPIDTFGPGTCWRRAAARKDGDGAAGRPDSGCGHLPSRPRSEVA